MDSVAPDSVQGVDAQSFPTGSMITEEVLSRDEKYPTVLTTASIRTLTCISQSRQFVPSRFESTQYVLLKFNGHFSSPEKICRSIKHILQRH